MAVTEPHPDPGSEDLARAALDRIPAMVAYWDTDQRCKFANRAYEQWFAVNPQQLIGTTMRALLGPVYELNRPHIEAALRGEPQEFERDLPDPHGGPIRHSLARYLPDVDGVVRGFYVHVTDISAVKRVERALETSEARFAEIIAIAADAIVCVDDHRAITLFNSAAEAMFGYRSDEVVGRDFLEVLVPERDRDNARHWFERLIGEGPGARGLVHRVIEVVRRRKSGEEFPVEITFSTMRIGDRAMLTAALRDITERKRAEAEQRLLAEAGMVLSTSLDYERTLASIAALVVRELAELCVVDMLDDDGKLTRLTVAHSDPSKADACRALAELAFDPQHVLASTTLATGKPHLFDDLSAAYVSSVAVDQTHLRLLLELGPPHSAISVPLVSTEGILGAIVLASSRPHQFTERDVSFASELARRAEIAIVNARLYQAARRATQARDDALGIVAHDVRSPLNAILLASELLARRTAAVLPQDGRDAIESIRRSVARANHLIEDLLDVTRIEAKSLAVAHDPVDVGEVVAEVVASHRLVAEAAGVELHSELEPGLPAVAGDQHRLLQVFENLLGNALRYTPQGGIITVGACARPGEVEMFVSDSGPGIPAANLTRVFERFWQASRAERRGAGLGLPICKGIVESHRGRIWVESAEVRGATFRLTLPAVVVSDPR